MRGTKAPFRVTINLLMKRHVALMITTFYVFGALGIPVVAYTCAETGEAGVVAILAGPPKTCHVDSCCDEDRDAPNVRIQTEFGCCHVDIQNAPESGFLFLPCPKYGPGEQFPKAHSSLDASMPAVCVVSAPPLIAAIHPPINLPLLI